MKKKFIIILLGLIVMVIMGLFLATGRARTDVYLGDFELSKDGKTMTLKVGVSSSAGYIRKMKRSSGSTNYYYTFYSTFGFNSKLGAKDTFIIDIDNNVDEIYFYTGGKDYKKVLEKDDENNWIMVREKIDVAEKINKIVENGPMTSSNPFHYVEASKDIYEELLAHPKETFEYSIKDLIETNADNGLKSYIEALLCSNINTNFKYDFESANDYLDNYKKYLEKNNIEFNDYDNYTKKILK